MEGILKSSLIRHHAIIRYSIILTGVLAIGLFFLAVSTPVKAQGSQHLTYTVKTSVDGQVLEDTFVNGSPTPPPGTEAERRPINLSAAISPDSIVSLPVPTYEWVFSCGAVSGSMIAAYYDRNGYPNIYTGPTNGGVMPMDSSPWPAWTDGAGATYAQVPLAASRQGLDGRATRGSLDDYWVSYGSSAQDPYITNGWTQHTWGDAVGDYMKSSQSAYGNSDGSTQIWTFSSASSYNCTSMSATAKSDDGTYGRKLFYEAKGYTVTDCYNQHTDNFISGGFSLSQFQAEIDSGNPVYIFLHNASTGAGHFVVGMGYDTASNTIYINDTWDYSNHAMIWGGSYSNMPMESVGVVHLAKSASTTTITANSPDPSFTNLSYTVSVTVSGAYGNPSGSVTISDGSASCQATLSGGAGSCDLTSTSPGNKTLTATYPGDLADNPSSGTTAHQVLTRVILPVIIMQ